MADRVLLVGINNYPDSPLSGCVNDITDMAKFLTTKCEVKAEVIRMLTDARATTKEIRTRLDWLVSGLKTGDRILFHYSGHGVQIATRNPKGELDGLDECVCPVDFDWSDNKLIRDKEFCHIFGSIPEGVSAYWVSDSCHSGNLQKEMLPPKQKEKRLIPPVDIQWRIDAAKEKGLSNIVKTLPGIILISGCQSDQTSADAWFNKRANGALTYYLLQELNKPNGLNTPLPTIVSNVTKALRAKRFTQTPQLEGPEDLKPRTFLWKKIRHATQAR
jgi:hypothetical protein